MNITSPRGQEMADMLPPLYDASKVFEALLQAQGEELDLVADAITEMLAQFFLRTSTWSLDRWEALFNLPAEPGFTDSQRQDRLVSKMRGYGTANKALLEGIAESYVYGTSTVSDLNDDPTLPDYTIRIHFIDAHGVPSNLADLQVQLREATPAHLDIVYQFTYRTWTEQDALNLDWDAVDALALDWDSYERL